MPLQEKELQEVSLRAQLLLLLLPPFCGLGSWWLGELKELGELGKELEELEGGRGRWGRW